MDVLVVGAGGIGQFTALRLAAAGHAVRLASRSGSGLSAIALRHAGQADAAARVRTLALDAADPAALARAARGTKVLVNAMNPPYTRWAELWPPLAASLLAAAETSGAGLVTVGNLYAYGRVDAPMTEATPLQPNGTKGRVRARMWAEALAAHQSGRVRAVEVRASDYFGPGAGQRTSFLNEYVIGPAARGAVARVPLGDPDAVHAWTYLPDIGSFVAAVAQADQSGPDWGRVWHVPTTPPRSMSRVAADVAELAGVRARGVRLMPGWLLAAARVVPLVRELDETRHQFERPFVLDSTAAERRFGLDPTPWQDALRATLDATPVPA